MFRLIRRWFNHNLYRKRVTIGIVCCFVSSAKSEVTDAERFIDTETATATQSNTLKRAYNRAQTDIPLSIILNPPTQYEKTEWANRRAQAKALQIGFGRYIPPPYDKNLEPLMAWIRAGLSAEVTPLKPAPSRIQEETPITSAYGEFLRELRFLGLGLPDPNAKISVLFIKSVGHSHCELARLSFRPAQ